MYGAILGDIIGSPYEFDRGEKTKEFPLFNVTFEPGCRNNWHIHHADKGRRPNRAAYDIYNLIYQRRNNKNDERSFRSDKRMG